MAEPFALVGQSCVYPPVVLVRVPFLETSNHAGYA